MRLEGLALKTRSTSCCAASGHVSNPTSWQKPRLCFSTILLASNLCAHFLMRGDRRALAQSIVLSIFRNFSRATLRCCAAKAPTIPKTESKNWAAPETALSQRVENHSVDPRSQSVLLQYRWITWQSVLVPG